MEKCKQEDELKDTGTAITTTHNTTTITELELWTVVCGDSKKICFQSNFFYCLYLLHEDIS